jgi:hypothetical protein
MTALTAAASAITVALLVAPASATGASPAAASEPPFYAAVMLGSSWMGVVSSTGRRYSFPNNSFLDSGSAAFAPRGAAVVYALCCEHGQGAKLRIKILDGGNRIVRLRQAPSAPPVFAPDGRVAYATGTRIHYVDGPALAATGLPKGARIAYVAVSPRTPLAVTAAAVTWGDARAGTAQEGLYLISPAGSRRVPISFDALSELPQPIWSPNGDKIAFVRSGTYRGGDIYIVDADGSHVVRLTSSTRASNPVWSPDGTQIAFTQRYGYKPHHSNGVPEVYLTRLNGAQRRLTHTRALPPPRNGIPGSYTPPGSRMGAWSPDGRWIAVATNGALGVVPAAGGRERIVQRLHTRVDLTGIGPIAWPRR